jgi:hypothetical protein
VRVSLTLESILPAFGKTWEQKDIRLRIATTIKNKVLNVTTGDWPSEVGGRVSMSSIAKQLRRDSTVRLDADYSAVHV